MGKKGWTVSLLHCHGMALDGDTAKKQDCFSLGEGVTIDTSINMDGEIPFEKKLGYSTFRQGTGK